MLTGWDTPKAPHFGDAMATIICAQRTARLRAEMKERMDAQFNFEQLQIKMLQHQLQLLQARQLQGDLFCPSQRLETTAQATVPSAVSNSLQPHFLNSVKRENL